MDSWRLRLCDEPLVLYLVRRPALRIAVHAAEARLRPSAPLLFPSG